MKHTWKRLLSLFMSLCLLAGLMPAALAALPTATDYIQDTDGVDSGAVYAIYTNEGSYSNDRILYHTGTDKTDKVQGSVSGDQLTLNGKFNASRQLWTITAVENGYAVQSVDSGRYLDLTTASDTNVNTSADPVVLTINFDGETGLYTFVHNGGQSLSYNGNGNFFSSETAYGFRLYKQTEVEPDMAPGADSGTSAGQPFVKDDTDSQYFRIPALITLSNGWIVAASDIRWRTSGDSPQNLDTIVSVSKDGGKTWNWEVVNYYDDMADNATGQGSASFIDPSILQTEDGTIHMVVDACPSYVGLMWGNKMGWNSSGFDDQGRLLVTKGSSGGDASTDVDDYIYYVDINNAEAGVEKSVNGETITLYPICNAEDGSQTGVWVDAWLDVYVEDEGVITPDLCLQLQSSSTVQSNLFYRNSEWKVYPVFYIMHRSATVTENGLKWSTPQFLNIKLAEDEAFTGACPGRGLSFQYEGHERLVFPLYDNATKTELASVIYSDDGGKTWTRGEHTNNLNGTGKTSESQVVLLPDGTLRMYSRNTIGTISYTDSDNGGQTWGTTQKDSALTYTSNCMVSFINLKGILVSPDNTVYDNLILASYPKGSSGNRTDGVVRIGYVGDGNVVHWLNSDVTRFSGGYSYSCLTQLSEPDTFGLLYEYAPDTNTIGYTTLTVTDLLGQGWYLLSGASDLPSISLDQTVVDLMVGQTATLTPTYAPADAVVTWTSSNPDAATVAGGVVSAKAPGTATITASVTSSGITRTASADVAVQGEDGVILPGRYTDEVEKSYHQAATTYELDTDGIDSGSVYAIFHTGSSRILYHASGSATSDHVTGSTSDGLLKLDGSYDAARQTWTVTGNTESGYTIQSRDDNKYLNLNTVSAPNSKVPVTDDAQALTITPVDGSAGSYTVSRVVDDQPLYLSHENGTTQHYVGTAAVPFQFYRQVVTEEGYTYATSVTGLEALINDLSGLNAADYTAASWATLQDALTAARNVANTGSQSFDTIEAAQTAQTTIEQAAKDLYAAKLALVEAGSGSASTSTTTTYAITVKSADNGSVTASRTRAAKNLTITLTVKADEGYALDTLTVTDKNGKDIKLTDKGSGKYSFTMPASAVTVSAAFKAEQAQQPQLPFTDVDAGSWYADSVRYVYEQGLMGSTGEGRFSPDLTTSRAMIVTILYRLEGSPAVTGGTSFADVTAGQWYSDGVAWASANGIVTGYSNGSFGPNDTITREQMAAILYRYARYKGYDLSARADLGSYSDAVQVSSYTADAMGWAVGSGLITGTSGTTLSPAGSATRAQAAVILARFCQTLVG